MGHEFRASIARTCTTGARLGSTPFSRLLLRRGRRAGGHDGGLYSMAAGGHSRESTRLVDPGCKSANDRSSAQPNCPSRKGNRGGQRGRPVVPTLEIESDMDPDDTLILLFMC